MKMIHCPFPLTITTPLTTTRRRMRMERIRRSIKNRSPSMGTTTTATRRTTTGGNDPASTSHTTPQPPHRPKTPPPWHHLTPPPHLPTTSYPSRADDELLRAPPPTKTPAGGMVPPPPRCRRQYLAIPCHKRARTRRTRRSSNGTTLRGCDTSPRPLPNRIVIRDPPRCRRIPPRTKNPPNRARFYLFAVIPWLLRRPCRVLQRWCRCF
mmetsp:Transcript_5498/g.6867  ORF Transcript_5498/g.6867 Transcript_5498/m.6867 type:complete len:209 (-) Transcript_5498:400-1026(-)